ncbi:integrase catalytic domain-containing protein [Nephila pilipes]|uniref:Integrase catalytic domain-containing protein n=1 Tax=Nephila pilipes TaxID=299642 RepID=A0A8X6NI35_NEPPI|nr:integrase catalytic domain-containing protein [Nephila pilipes]
MSQWAAKGFDTYPVDTSVSLGSNKTKVLGLAWKILYDCLTLVTKGLLELISTNKNTKRFLLQAIGKIFEPLGLLSPFTIRMKCLIQELWKNKTTWDEDLPPKIVERFIFNCKNPGNKEEGPLTSEEMLEAEYLLLKQEKLRSFHIEMIAMQNADDICHKIGQKNKLVKNPELKENKGKSGFLPFAQIILPGKEIYSVIPPSVCDIGSNVSIIPYNFVSNKYRGENILKDTNL